jgi:hypothetical protein
MCGWGSEASPLNEDDKCTWVNRVYYIARIVEHNLVEIPLIDHKKPGLYNACYTEKKLVAHFIDRDVFTPRDAKLDQQPIGPSIRVRDEASGIKRSVVLKTEERCL